MLYRCAKFAVAFAVPVFLYYYALTVHVEHELDLSEAHICSLTLK